jgi:hypothetical protein
MNTIDGTKRPRTKRPLRLAGICVAVMWFLAMIVTDGIQQGVTRNIITDAAAAQHTILSHQDAIVVESISSFYLAALLIVFGAALRPILGEGVPGFAVFGGAVLAAVAIVLGGAVSFAELAAAHHHNTGALLTLGYLVAFAWSWEGAAWGFLLLATGWAILVKRTAPRWFAIATIVLGVPTVFGVGAVLFWALAPVWFAAAGFMVRSRNDDRATVTPLATPAIA